MSSCPAPDTTRPNEPDAHGVYPLHYAAHCRDAASVSALLAAGADPAARSKAGWSVLHEALAAGDAAVVAVVVDALNEKYRRSYTEKVERVLSTLGRTCDFSASVSWQFVSWVPLVGWFLPSDTIRIFKSGSRFRFDMNVVGLNYVQPVHQQSSLLFLGGEGKGETYFINHARKTVQKVRATKHLDASELLRQPAIKTHVSTTKVPLVRTGVQKERLGYACDEYQLPDIPWVSKKRQRSAVRAPTPPIDDGLLCEGESLSVKRRQVTASVLLARDFPVSVADILPMIRVVSSCSVSEKIRAFVEANLSQSSTFPVSLTVPIKCSVAAKMKITAFKQKTVSSSRFALPTHYTFLD